MARVESLARPYVFACAMDGITFETFDPTPYQRVPIVTLQSTVVLAKALVDGKPLDATAAVNMRADKLHEGVGQAEDELTERRREHGDPDYGIPVVLDNGTDGLWGLCYRKLEAQQVYLHPAFDPFIAKPETALGQSLAESRERAERAAAMHERLFGGEGLLFLKSSFRDQSEVTGSILRLIKADELADELSDLVGAALVQQLFGLQDHYEAMVIDQLKNPNTGLANLNKLRRRLARLIGQYNNAVLDMLDEDKPETLKVVMTALRPMLTLRELVAATNRKNGSELQDGGSSEGAMEQGTDEPGDNVVEGEGSEQV